MYTCTCTYMHVRLIFSSIFNSSAYEVSITIASNDYNLDSITALLEGRTLEEIIDTLIVSALPDPGFLSLENQAQVVIFGLKLIHFLCYIFRLSFFFKCILINLFRLWQIWLRVWRRAVWERLARMFCQWGSVWRNCGLSERRGRSGGAVVHCGWRRC